MKVLFDIVHPADVNVFSHSIASLLSEGHSVSCTVLERGRLLDIVKKELHGVKIIPLGKHRSGVIGKIFGMGFRELKFIWLYLCSRFDVVVGFGFYAGMFGWMRSRTIHLHDDKEYKTMFFLSKLFCGRFISFVPCTGRKVLVIESYKELAYLGPSYVTFDEAVLEKIGLKGKYVYVREIANISVNYSGSKRIDYTDAFSYLREKGYTILLDAEGEHTYSEIVSLEGVFTLAEHNSIKKNASLIITSGDTVLREGALLGVPTIYTSDRKMAINKRLLRKGLYSVAKNSSDLQLLVEELVGKDVSLQAQTYVSTCKDINTILYSEILK